MSTNLSLIAVQGASRLAVDDAGLLRVAAWVSAALAALICMMWLGASVFVGPALLTGAGLPWLVFGGVCLPASLGLVAYSRFAKSAKAAQRLALAFYLLIALTISVAEWLIPETQRSFSGLSWVCLWLITAPLLLPLAPRHALIAVLGAAATGPASSLGAWGLGVPMPDTNNVVMYYVANFFCAVGAWLLVRLLDRLRSDLRFSVALGDYRLLRRLGSEDLSEVWLGEHRLLARPAIIKLVRLEAGTSDPALREALLRRFSQEALALASINSPHIIELFDYGIGSDGRLFYVMERLPGLAASAVHAAEPALPPRRVAHFWRQALDGLYDAHASGVLHGNLSLNDLFIAHAGVEFDVVKVGGFYLRPKAERSPQDEETQVRLDHARLAGIMETLLGAQTAVGDDQLIAARLRGHIELLKRSGSSGGEEAFQELLFEVREGLAELSATAPWRPDEAEQWWYDVGFELEGEPLPAAAPRRGSRDSVPPGMSSRSGSQLSGASQSGAHWIGKVTLR